MHYHAEYENHKLVHRYNQALLGEHHEWWKYTDDFRKCTYKNSLKDGTTDYEYDSHGNKTYEQSYLGEKFYEYDDSDNLISKKTINYKNLLSTSSISFQLVNLKLFKPKFKVIIIFYLR